jgi:hypothetical protein
MFHALYVVAFVILAVLALGNLIRNMMLLGADARRDPRPSFGGGNQPQTSGTVPHPEMLDETGKVTREPLLVMRSISVDDAREKLDALYEASDGNSEASSDESAD